MGILIRTPFNAFAEVERMLKARFWDKARERSNHAKQLAYAAQGTVRRCPLRHSRYAWSGPPHDTIRCYVCLDCGAVASEPEIKDRGLNFDTVVEEVIIEIFDLDLKRQSEMGNRQFFGGFGNSPLEKP